jgi:2-polyprenyl-6-methoxyphenol hydroxylase-like FAD-dependent oxidoreductase
LEKSRSLRADGAGIGVHANGLRVLEQLGVAAELRETAQLITVYMLCFIYNDNNIKQKISIIIN